MQGNYSWWILFAVCFFFGALDAELNVLLIYVKRGWTAKRHDSNTLDIGMTMAGVAILLVKS